MYFNMPEAMFKLYGSLHGGEITIKKMKAKLNPLHKKIVHQHALDINYKK